MEIQDMTPTEHSSEPDMPPAVVRVREVPAAIDARNALLEAIAQEARAIVDAKHGKASEALYQLAQAYAMLSTTPIPMGTDGASMPAPIQTRAGGHQVGLCLELEP
ncbi:hypothetical protein HLB23_36270 [Nocardia uniformis]|uniref:Uncharacterized protein n=1 Tax=Nocardia uniformis TaxID=53432 RepID=A0A849CBZ8_9NOCA|nr:hypothetical protein [Nocardia uniformis]NNH75248.1 hypothetical protein [Nocardia uniformis]